jgi:hypothetical protein
MAKLTLSVDEAVVRRAKRYAAGRGTSVSDLVELPDLLARPLRRDEMPPVLRLPMAQAGRRRRIVGIRAEVSVTRVLLDPTSS